MSYYYFKKIAINKFLKNEYDFTLKKNTLSNIYYRWRSNYKVFNWISIFDNIYTLDDKLYLRYQYTTLLYDEKNKNNYWHKHIIWISPIFIKILQETPHLYIDATYISTKDYYQLVIIMAYYTLIDLKFPCSYILMNNKNEKSYELVFKNLLNIITMDNSIDLKIISIKQILKKEYYLQLKQYLKILDTQDVCFII